jgi:hypothetical protein
MFNPIAGLAGRINWQQIAEYSQIRDAINTGKYNVDGRNPLLQNVMYDTLQFKTDIKKNSVGLPMVKKENPSGSDLTSTPDLKFGVPSFINPYAVLTFPSKWEGSFTSGFNTIIDNPSSARKFSSPSYMSFDNGVENIEPSVFNLVNHPPDGSDTGPGGAKMPYRYTDFLYCKYYGIIPNNFLVTLRRYPAPTYDNLDIPLPATFKRDATNPNRGTVTFEGSQYDFKPIAQAVTWLGEATGNKLSDILGFEVSMNWKLYESQVEVYNGNEQSANEGPDLLRGAGKLLAITRGVLGGDFNSANEERNYNYDPYANGPYSHRVYGPVNVISKTYKRDRGIDFKQSFNITFEYSLKSISGINPKAAMIDIMSNMLTLTYNNAAFWGGANRYFAQRPVYPFLGGKDGQNAWYRGDPLGFVGAVRKALTGPGGVLSEVSKFFEQLQQDPISALKSIAANGASVYMNILGSGRAPDIVGMKAILTGEPIGEWHMVVGNPYSPILKIGNLICTGAKFEFNDTLGADNFPTEMKVIVTLEHGRPRDAGDIQSMFNEGEGRTYYAPMGNKDVFYSSAQENSANTTTEKWSRRTAANIELQQKPPAAVPTKKQQNVAPAGTGTKTNATNNNAPNQNANVPAQGTGADLQFDKLGDDLSYPFNGKGHELAIKMGLASAGEYKTVRKQ